MEIDWEAELAGLLADLSQVQQELLALLADKQRRLARAEVQFLPDLDQREQHLIDRLQACQDRRSDLLAKASAQGLPSHNLRALSRSSSLSQGNHDAALRQAEARTRLLQHHSLTNWVLAQQTLLHLAQLLEILGSGGRFRPTYGKGEPSTSVGALLDRAV